MKIKNTVFGLNPDTVFILVHHGLNSSGVANNKHLMKIFFEEKD